MHVFEGLNKMNFGTRQITNFPIYVYMLIYRKIFHKNDDNEVHVTTTILI